MNHEESASAQQNGDADPGVDLSTDLPFNIIVELPNEKTTELNVSPLELVQETHQRLMDMHDTCHRTCFHLTFNGVTLDNFAELKSIEGLKEGSVIKFVEGESSGLIWNSMKIVWYFPDTMEP